jgi:hypothetical protein
MIHADNTLFLVHLGIERGIVRRWVIAITVFQDMDYIQVIG